MSLVDRVKGILLTPAKEWEVIEGETATVGSLYSSYIVPLAAIPAIAGFIGLSLFGVSLLGTTIRVSVSSGIEGAITRYVLTLVMVYVLGLIIDGLAPTFGGTKNPIQALKVATYSSTASWVAGIFTMIPGLRFFSILGLYSLYLLYVGLPPLMKSPPEKSMGYTVVVILAAAVLFFFVGAVTARFVGTPSMGL